MQCVEFKAVIYLKDNVRCRYHAENLRELLNMLDSTQALMAQRIVIQKWRGPECVYTRDWTERVKRHVEQFNDLPVG